MNQVAVALPLFPLEDAVVLPGVIVTLQVGTSAEEAAVAAALDGDGRLVLLPRVRTGFAKIGTVGRIEQSGRLPDGSRALVVRGEHRGEVAGAAIPEGDALVLNVIERPDPTAHPDSVAGPAREYRVLVDEVVKLRRAGREVREFLRGVTDPGALADTIGYSPDATFEEKVAVLEAVDVGERLAVATTTMRRVLDELRITEELREGLSEDMDKQQREFLLRRQMQRIQEELGDADGGGSGDYRARLEQSGMPAQARAEFERELGRLERSGGQGGGPEAGMIRTYLDWMLDIPWAGRSTDTLDLDHARAVLDADHTGLDDVKERIVEFLAVRKLRADRELVDEPGSRAAGLILTLAGPPGVGKTSLGESVARALGRRYVRMSLGGVHDEAEIRGHRRTYIGALPGRLVRALKEAGTMNPVIVLDEVDKLGRDWRGDPSSALLEVLDPAQNHSFRDHYLDVELDLSEVLFLATANQLESIPGPLLDRMDVLRLDGYTEDEKVVIARTHLLPRQVTRAGLRPGELDVRDAALRQIVASYTREAGVRSLERELARLTRKAATRVAGGGETPIVVEPEHLHDLLGREKVWNEVAARVSTPGVATGLAVTGAGGDVLFVEAALVPGEARLTLTGQLGDVMKESAGIALSYVRSHAAELGVPDGALAGEVHVHVPAGAIPKDGPSAGVTMTTALVSLATGRPVRADVGMTGEVTLQGKVLPIGGVRQKVLAAHRAGLKTVILPERNGPDLEDVPEAVLAELDVVLAADVGKVLETALEPEAA